MGVERVELGPDPVGQLLEQSGERPLAGQLEQPAEPEHHGVVGKERDMSESASTREQHCEHEHDQRGQPDIAGHPEAKLGVPQHLAQLERANEATDQLQAGVGCQALVAVLDVQVALDFGLESALSYPHWKFSFDPGFWCLQTSRHRIWERFRAYSPSRRLFSNVGLGLVTKQLEHCLHRIRNGGSHCRNRLRGIDEPRSAQFIPLSARCL